MSEYRNAGAVVESGSGSENGRGSDRSVVEFEGGGRNEESKKKIGLPDLTREIGLELKITQKDVREILDLFVEKIKEKIATGSEIHIREFGIFRQIKRQARVGMNPRTRSRVEIPETVIPIFNAAKSFKDQVSGELLDPD